MYNNMNYQGAPYQFAQPRKVLPYTNALTEEEKKLLKQTNPGFTLALTPEEIARAKCTHRDPQTHTLTVDIDQNGVCTCRQCGSTFNILEAVTPDTIAIAVNSVVDIAENAKMLYVDLSPEVITGFFPMIAMLKKLPQLYEIAQKTFMSDSGSDILSGFNNNVNPWMMMNHVTNGGGMNMGMGMPYGYPQQPVMQQPNYNYGFNNYSYPQQPVMQQPVYDYTQQVGGNPIQQGVTPNAQYAGYTYGYPQQPMTQSPYQVQSTPGQADLASVQAENEKLKAQLSQMANNPAIADKHTEQVTTTKRYNV